MFIILFVRSIRHRTQHRSGCLPHRGGGAGPAAVAAAVSTQADHSCGYVQALCRGKLLLSLLVAKEVQVH